MTRILVTADTHMPRRGRALPGSMLQAARDSDLIAHLGDFTESEFVRDLERLAPLVGVHGNNDSFEVRDRFPLEQRFTVEGKRVVMIHGHVGGRTAYQAALAVEDADVVLFGHSHQARLVHERDRILLNPGSPTERRFSPFTSYALLTVDRGVSAEIVQLS